MFKGLYNGKQCHVSDIATVLSRAWTAGVDRIIVSFFLSFFPFLHYFLLSGHSSRTGYCGKISFEIGIRLLDSVGDWWITRGIKGGSDNCRNRWFFTCSVLLHVVYLLWVSLSGFTNVSLSNKLGVSYWFLQQGCFVLLACTQLDARFAPFFCYLLLFCGEIVEMYGLLCCFWWMWVMFYLVQEFEESGDPDKHFQSLLSLAKEGIEKGKVCSYPWHIVFIIVWHAFMGWSHF